MRFFKMQNCGNDYIFIFEKPSKQLIKKLCNRNFGIGGDGVVYLYKKGERYGYEIYIRDASKATFCGSVTLCLGFYLYKNYGVENMEILTDCGAKKVCVKREEKSIKVGVEVGKPHFQAKINNEKDRVFNRLLLLKDKGKTLRIRATLVNVGNLHLVIKGNYLKSIREKIVMAINKDQTFKAGVNVEFVNYKNDQIKTFVYERGSGETLCCSSGACAVFAVLNKSRFVGDNAVINFRGGKLQLCLKSGKIWVFGQPKLVFEGEFDNI